MAIVSTRYSTAQTFRPEEFGLTLEDFERESRRLMRPPVVLPSVPPMSPPRSIAVIEAEIRRAVVPALRAEDV